MRLDSEPKVRDVVWELTKSSAKFGTSLTLIALGARVAVGGEVSDILIGAALAGGGVALYKFFYDENMLVSDEFTRLMKQVEKGEIK